MIFVFFTIQILGKEIVGIVEVIKTAFIDPTDKEKRFVAVKVKYKSKLKTPVSLENIKKNKEFKRYCTNKTKQTVCNANRH